jgi:di/tricarboxylate transporter
MVAALFPLSVAIERSGVAEDIAGGLVDLVGDAGPHALLRASSSSPPCSAS